MEYLIFLRLIHIVCAVIWAGSMIYFAVFMIPAAKILGPGGYKFIQQLSGTKKLPVTMVVTATLTIITGILLMLKLFGRFRTEWFSSTHMILLISGGILSLTGYIIGLIVNITVSRRMSAIGKSLARSGTGPAAEQSSELQILQKRSFAATTVIAILLFASLILMSIVKYY